MITRVHHSEVDNEGMFTHREGRGQDSNIRQTRIHLGHPSPKQQIAGLLLDVVSSIAEGHTRSTDRDATSNLVSLGIGRREGSDIWKVWWERRLRQGNTP